MTVCSNTGITVPECSCRSCLQGQIERHMPSLLDVDPSRTAATVEIAAAPSLSRLRFGRRVRRLRRAA
jgi:phosphoribosyl 1,2-cyclic phosphodiesterase